LKTFYNVSSNSDISDVSQGPRREAEGNAFFEKCKKRAKNPAMAGLMAVLMKEIAIMNAEANPDVTSDDDCKSPVP
jgi:hypothetical protein